MKKLLLLLSFVSVVGSVWAMEQPSQNIDRPTMKLDFQTKKDSHPAIQFAFTIFSFAAAEDAIHTIIAQELQHSNPNKWTARAQFNGYMKKHVPTFSQNEKNELMNLFYQRWQKRYNK